MSRTMDGRNRAAAPCRHRNGRALDDADAGRDLLQVWQDDRYQTIQIVPRDRRLPSNLRAVLQDRTADRIRRGARRGIGKKAINREKKLIWLGVFMAR
jgi:hypothetical protein